MVTRTKLADILLQPIPDFAQARKLKVGYRREPLKVNGERNKEPLVDIAQYGIAGQSHYSRLNRTTGEPVPGVSPIVRVRQSLAERLADINLALQQSRVVADLLGGTVELYVDEGLRSVELQRKLYYEYFPEMVAKYHPSLSAAEVRKRTGRMIAKPPAKGESPSPHATGAAVDIRLRRRHPDLGFVPGQDLEMGRHQVGAGEAAYPDYFERKKSLTAANKIAQRNRRTFYWIMRGALIEDDSGFVVNPTEWWHWSWGDQLWARLTQAPEAFFSFPTLP